MKKFVLLLLLSLLCFSLFASAKLAVCIYPENNDLSRELSKHFPDIEIKKASVNIANNLLETGDQRLMEYICMNSKADIIIMPINELMNDFNHYSIYTYKSNNGQFKQIYSVIMQGAGEYPDSIYYDLAQILLDEDKINSFVVNPPTDRSKLESIKLTVDQGVKYSHDSDAYKKARGDFYKMFAGTLLSFGGYVAVQSVGIENANVVKYLKYGALGSVGVFGFFMVRNLIRYCKFAEFVN